MRLVLVAVGGEEFTTQIDVQNAFRNSPLSDLMLNGGAERAHRDISNTSWLAQLAGPGSTTYSRWKNGP
jgi:hypothetical protein